MKEGSLVNFCNSMFKHVRDGFQIVYNTGVMCMSMSCCDVSFT